MQETWLKTNRRILVVGCCAFASIAAIGLLLALFGGTTLRWLGIGIGVVSLLGMMSCLWTMRQPRLGFIDDWLVVNLTTGAPTRVPIEVVECFFLGQASTDIESESDKEVETSTVVVRLAERAKEWHERKTKSSLGRWCDGYIVVHGTWCEPISPELLKQMNHRLAEIHRQRNKAS